MRTLNRQDLIDLVDGAAIFSAGGGGDPEAGYKIVKELSSHKIPVKIVDPSEVPGGAKVVNFACVGATTTIDYDSEAAVKTLRVLEEYANFQAFAVIPVELGGFNTLAAVDVAARCGIPVVDADGAGRAVPEVHLKVYTIDDIPLTPMTVADIHAENIVLVKETRDARAAERIARILAAEWEHSAYTARRILNAEQVRTSPVQRSLSKAMKIGKILRETKDPVKNVLEETEGCKLFEGVVNFAEKETKGGFTFVTVRLEGSGKFAGKTFEFKAKNEVLIAYRNGKLAAIAPDIITPVHPKTGKCITAEKIVRGQQLAVLGLPAPEKWRTSKGLELWRDVLRRSGISEEYVPIERLTP
ncbi:MAG: DUF917 domain-containing protein [Candidatus Bathyarchaeota archaeon]|nr:DUF917 domain-containing protein [Candidatus Bathyarchaeota archaeon A05DMB-3]MDH7606364.1 DUF917 domain-containing protein [Candidatus Bathyarchaeota archaeon]